MRRRSRATRWRWSRRHIKLSGTCSSACNNRSAVSEAFLSWAVAMLRRMPRMVALTCSSFVVGAVFLSLCAYLMLATRRLKVAAFAPSAAWLERNVATVLGDAGRCSRSRFSHHCLKIAKSLRHARLVAAAFSLVIYFSHIHREPARLRPVAWPVERLNAVSLRCVVHGVFVKL